jgi:cytochrome c-type biogenesis protein CcmH/NrfF
MRCGPCLRWVANCNHPNCEFSVPVREQIESMLHRGMGRAKVIAYFRNKYCEKILSAPTTQGPNLLAWTTPFIVLAFGGVLIVLTVGRWHRGAPKPTEAPVAGETSAVIDPELRRRLERELRERI